MPQNVLETHVRAEPSLRERKNLRTRQSILEEAARLFLVKGYSATTLKDIADAAETSVATIMRYFSSKDAILLYRDRAVLAKFEERVRARSYRTLGEGVRDAVWTSLLDLPERERLYDVIWADPACVPLIAVMRRAWEEALADLFRHFCPPTRDGRLRAVCLAAMLTGSGVAGMQFWHEDGQRLDIRTMQQELIDEFIVAFVDPIDRARAIRAGKDE